MYESMFGMSLTVDFIMYIISQRTQWKHFVNEICSLLCNRTVYKCAK